MRLLIRCSSLVLAAGLVGLACAHTDLQTTVRLVDGELHEGSYVSASAYEHYLAAQLALQRGDAERATRELQTAILFDPASPYLYTQLAVIAVRRGRSKDALARLEQALALDATFPDALVLRGRVLWQQRETPRAEESFRRCLAANPRHVAAYLDYAELLERADRTADARRVLSSLVARDKGSAEGHSRLALLCLRQVDYPCAARHLALTLQHRADVETLLRLAHVRRSRGQLREVVVLLREAFDRSGGTVAVAGALVEALLQAGEAQAVDDLLAVVENEVEESPEQVLELVALCLDARRPARALTLVEAQLQRGGAQTAALQLERAEALARLGRTAEAKDVLRPALVGAQGVSAALRLARVLQREGAPGEAAEVLRQALTRHGYHEGLVLGLSPALQLAGKAEASVRVIRDALAPRPDDRNLLFGLGAALERVGRWSEAVTVMRRIVARRPQDAPAHNFIGYTQVEHGADLPAAERSIRRALFLQPGEGYILDSLGWLFFRQGHLRQAAEVLAMAVHLAPREAEVIGHLAEARAALHDLTGALRLLREALAVCEDAKLTRRLKQRLQELEKGRVGRR